MNAVIVEDDADKLVLLKRLLIEYCKDVQVIGESTSADAGAKLIRETSPDLVFLDVHMPGKTGFAMLAELGQYSFGVIITSGYDEYALQAIKLSAIDFLLKPIQPLDLQTAVAKAFEHFQNKECRRQVQNLLSLLGDQDRSHHTIAVPLTKELLFLNPAEIIRCEAFNSYTKFYLQDKTAHMVSRSLKEYESLLAPYGFIRVHQSHLVNRKYIKSLRRDDNINEVLMSEKSLVPVSRLRVEELKIKMNAGCKNDCRSCT